MTILTKCFWLLNLTVCMLFLSAGKTALHLAAAGGHSMCVQRLLQVPSTAFFHKQSQEDRLMRNRVGMSHCWHITNPLSNCSAKDSSMLSFLSLPCFMFKALVYLDFFLWTFLCFWSPYETVCLRQGWSNLLHFFCIIATILLLPNAPLRMWGVLSGVEKWIFFHKALM